MLPLILAIAVSSPQASSSPPQSTKSDPCPLVIRLRRDGKVITYRFNGWRVTSMRTLESDLKGGCYNEANPSKVTSVTIEGSREAPPFRLKLLYEVLSRNGWSQDRTTIR